MSIKFIFLVDTSYGINASSLNILFRELTSFLKEKQIQFKVKTEICIFQFDRYVFPESPKFINLDNSFTFNDFSCSSMCSFGNVFFKLYYFLKDKKFKENEVVYILISNGNPMDQKWQITLDKLYEIEDFKNGQKLCIHFNTFFDLLVLEKFSRNPEYIFLFEKKVECYSIIENLYKEYKNKYDNDKGSFKEKNKEPFVDNKHDIVDNCCDTDCSINWNFDVKSEIYF